MGMVWFSRAVIPVMRENGGGSIINNSSIAGVKVWPDFAAYSATKFAVIGLTRSLALDFGKDGIRVNAVCPGDIDTQMGDIALELVAMQEGITVADVEGQAPGAIALGRRGLGEDVGRVVAWLAGPGSGYVSGASIPVEGAWAEGL
jgi:NAD(P)-dependent dehydrogenase (short-subunit alcohol dehydrogenase family)